MNVNNNHNKTTNVNSSSLSSAAAPSLPQNLLQQITATQTASLSTTTMTNAHHQQQHPNKQHQYAITAATAAHTNSNHSQRRLALGKNHKSQSLRRFYLPPSLTRLPHSNSRAEVSPNQAVVSTTTVKDTINSSTQHARMSRRQSTGGSGMGMGEGSISDDAASHSAASTTNIFSLTPAFPSPPQPQPQPQPQVLPITKASLHRRKTPRAVRRGSKKSLQRSRRHPDSPGSHHVPGSLSRAQVQALAQEEEQQQHNHNNRPRKQQRSISPIRRRTATTTTAATSKQHDEYEWESNATVHNRNRSHSPSPSFASSSSSSGCSSVVTNTTKQSSMMSIASSPSSLAHQSHQATVTASSSSSQAPVFPQVSSPQVSSSHAQAQQVMIPSSSSQVVSSSSQAAQAILLPPPPLWTEQFACAVTTTIQQEVDVMIQNGNLPVQSNNTFCDTLTPLDIVRSDDNDVLGSGAFSNVTRVSIRTTMNNNNNKNSQHPQQYFALKSLKRDLLPKVLDSSSAAAAAASVASSAADDDEEEVTSSSTVAGFVKAAQELAREAYLLSRFDHAHIISIKGWTVGGVSSYQHYKRHDAFFLLLELLDQENLEDRIARWNHEDKETLDDSDSSAASHQQHARKVEQLTICQQVAQALAYIHSKNVVYRDLKPQNIGFGRQTGSSEEGAASQQKIHVKLMDFGLARELPTANSNGRTIVPNQEEQQQHNNNRNRNMLLDMTGMVGTIRYMSPEIYLDQPYGVEADIYSWSIVSYEILSKTRPFNNMTPDLYRSFVCHQGVRPNTWHQHQCQQQQQQNQHQHGPQQECCGEGQLPSSDYLVLLANAWRTNPANRLPLNRIVRQLDLFLQKEQLLYEAQQIGTQQIMPTTNNNNEQSLIHQSFSYDNMNLRPTAAGANRVLHCGSTASVASSAASSSCGNKRNRRFVTDTNTNIHSNAMFPMNRNRNASTGMLRPYTTMNHPMHHNNKNYQQHHCDVMNAARQILSNDPIISTVPHHRPPHQLQRSQSQQLQSPSHSNFPNGSMHLPQQQFHQPQQFQQQQQQQFQQQQQQETMMRSPDHYYFMQHQQQQQQKEQLFLQEQQQQRAFTMRMMMTNMNTNNNSNNHTLNGNNNDNNGDCGSFPYYRRSISMPMGEGGNGRGSTSTSTNNVYPQNVQK